MTQFIVGICRQVRQLLGNGFLTGLDIPKAGLFSGHYSIAQQIRVFGNCRQNFFICHIDHGQRFHVQGLTVVFQRDLEARLQFSMGKDVMFVEYSHILLCQISRQCINGGLHVEQTTAGRLFHPFLRIVVAVKDNSLVIFNSFFDVIFQVCFEILLLFGKTL